MSLLSALQALSPAALYKHADSALATMTDSSGNARHGSYQANAKLKAFGLGNDRTTGTAYRCPGAGSSCLALPLAGAVWNSNTWTHVCVVRCWGFEDPGGAVWCADTNGVFDTPAVRFEAGAGQSYRPTIALRWGGLGNAATVDIGDTHLWHLVICRVNNLTAGSIRIDGVDATPVLWTNQAYTFSGAPQPTIGDNFGRFVLQYTAWWPSYLSNANCQTIEAAFNAENVTPVPTRSFYIGTHTNLDDQADAGIRANQTRVLLRDGGNVTRTDALVDQWNTGSGTYDFARLDTVFADCATKGIRVWLLLHGSAAYMNSSAGRFAVPGTGIDSAFNTWLGLQQTAIGALAARYKAGGAGNPNGLSPIYELWNEPNSQSEWKTQNGAAGPDATQWARYCKNVGGTTIPAADPAGIIVTGGINSWSAPGGGDIAGETFWRTAFGTGDLAGFTRFGIHPYPSSGAGPDDNSNSSNAYNDTLVAIDVLGELGFGTAELWITEIGWNASVSQADQDTKTRVAALRWRDRWLGLGIPSFIDWPDWSAGSDGLYTSMPTDGSNPAARAAAATYSRLMRSVTIGERVGGISI